MNYKLLGRSGVRVSELALGTMTFGEDWGWGASKEASRAIFELFAEAGGNFIDTACNYTNGTAEKFVGEFVHSERERFVVATKYTLTTRKDDPNAGGNHRKNLVQTVEGSLRRLNTDFIDLLWVHVWDFTTSVEMVMRSLDDIVRSGKVLHVGISDSPAWIVAQANTLAELRGWSPFVALQLPYNLGRRDPERDALPMAQAFGMAVTAWGLIGGGVLTGKYRDQKAVKRYDGAGERSLEIGDKVKAIAEKIGCSPAQAAINWARQQKRSGAHPAPAIIPIIGARTQAQMEENLGCLGFELTDEQIERLGNVAPFEVGFAQSFYADNEVIELIYGDTFSRIENPPISA